MFDSPNQTIAYSELFPDLDLSQPLVDQGKDFHNICFGENVHPVFDPMTVTPLAHRIMNVISIRTGLDMSRVITTRAITQMQNSFAPFELSKTNFKRFSGNPELFVPSSCFWFMGNPISTGAQPAWPVKAGVGVPWEAEVIFQFGEAFHQILVSGTIVLLHLRALLWRILHWADAVSAARPFLDCIA
jgi:hypothetical protein